MPPLIPLPWLLTLTARSEEELQRDVPDPLQAEGEVAEIVTMAVTTMDLVGVVFFAVSGAVLAVRKGYDIMGSLLLCLMVATGGGIIRDLIINDDVPAAFRNPAYLLLPLVAAALVYFRVIDRDRGRHTVMFFDAIGLSVYCVVGTRIALIGGMGPVSAVVLGLVTAVGGGIIRDVVAGEPPAVFGGRGWYALPALLGAVATGLLGWAEWLNIYTSVAVMLVVLALRLLSLRRQWAAPAADITGDTQEQRLDPDDDPPVEDVRDREGQDGDPADPGEPDEDREDVEEGRKVRRRDPGKT